MLAIIHHTAHLWRATLAPNPFLSPFGLTAPLGVNGSLWRSQRLWRAFCAIEKQSKDFKHG